MALPSPLLLNARKPSFSKLSIRTRVTPTLMRIEIPVGINLRNSTSTHQWQSSSVSSVSFPPPLPIQHLIHRIITFVFGDDVLHFADGFHLVEGLGGFDQVVNFARDVIEVILADLGDMDLLVECRLGAFQLVQDFFVEFLTLADPGVLDLFSLGDRYHCFWGKTITVSALPTTSSRTTDSSFS